MDFDKIAGIYGLFFDFQRKNYCRVFRKIDQEISLGEFRKVIDIGCGTGALCSVLEDLGLQVTGIDPSKKMLEIARKKNDSRNIKFHKENVLEGLPFEDKCFDISVASYVAHGLSELDRKKMYKEMKRISRYYVLIYDYNQTRSFFTDIAEKAEGGDYFNFIKNAEKELKEHFTEVKVIQTDKKAACYIGKI